MQRNNKKKKTTYPIDLSVCRHNAASYDNAIKNVSTSLNKTLDNSLIKKDQGWRELSNMLFHCNYLNSAKNIAC